MLKKIDSEFIAMVIIPLVALYNFLHFLITSNMYYLILIVIALILTFIVIYFIKKTFKNSYLLTFGVIFVFTFVVFSFALRVSANNSKTEIFTVKLIHYSYRKNHGATFKFNNQNFKRPLNCRNYSKEDLINNYNVKLSLKQPLRGIYYIESMDLIHKDSLLTD